MTQGTKVIFNQEYIEEITRHRDYVQKKFNVETNPAEKHRLELELNNWQKKLDWALDFVDRVDMVKNMDIPQLTVIKTLKGYELPVRNVQIV